MRSKFPIDNENSVVAKLELLLAWPNLHCPDRKGLCFLQRLKSDTNLLSEANLAPIYLLLVCNKETFIKSLSFQNTINTSRVQCTRWIYVLYLRCRNGQAESSLKKKFQFQSYSDQGVANPLNRSFFKTIFSFTVLFFSYQHCTERTV